jgi:preprotein translocase subunit SecD
MAIAFSASASVRRAALAAIGGALLLSPLAARPGGAEPGDWATQITLQAPTPARRQKAPRPGQIQAALQARLPILTRGQGTITVAPEGRIQVQVPERTVAPAQVDWFLRPGAMQFVWMKGVQGAGNPDARYVMSTYRVHDVHDHLEFRFLDRQEQRFVGVDTIMSQAKRIVDGSQLEADGAEVLPGAGSPVISLKFGPQGTRALAAFTRKHVGQPMAIVLDGQLLFGPLPVPPRPREVSPSGKVKYRLGPLEEGRLAIAPIFRIPEEASYLATILNAGPLPMELKLVKQITVVEEEKPARSPR